MRVKAESLSNKAGGSAPNPGKALLGCVRIFTLIFIPPPNHQLHSLTFPSAQTLTSPHRLIWASRGPAPTFLRLIGPTQEGGSELRDARCEDSGCLIGGEFLCSRQGKKWFPDLRFLTVQKLETWNFFKFFFSRSISKRLPRTPGFCWRRLVT